MPTGCVCESLANRISGITNPWHRGALEIVSRGVHRCGQRSQT
jgi:hypothetical protein